MQPPPSSEPPPPPFAYQPPPRKGMPGWGWALIGCGCLGALAVVAILAAILFPVFAQAREKARQGSCLSNERQMTLGLLQYAQDYDGRLPASPAWMDAINSYTRHDFHCPTASVQDPDKYGYAFDSRLRAKSILKINNPASTMLLYDSTTLRRNATDPGTSLPSPGRHLGGNNIAYLDGDVRNTREALP